MKKITQEEILQILKSVLDDSDIEVNSLDTAVRLDDQEIDSLDMMNIIFQIQDDFNVEISEESLEEGKWLTIDKIVKNLNVMLEAS